MKLTGIFLLATALHVSAGSIAQTVTYSARSVPLAEVFSALEKQTGYVFFYNKEYLQDAAPVTVDLKEVPLEQALAVILTDEPLSFAIRGNTIVIMRKELILAPVIEPLPPVDIHGRVIDSTGTPLSGATVVVKGSRRGTITDANGNFELKRVAANVTLIISFTGFADREVKPVPGNVFTVVMSRSVSPLDQIQIVAYGQTTVRFNTGDVSTVTSKEISEQPVTNVLAAIEGRVPGLIVTQTTGAPGGKFTVQIRGQNSIANGNDPFFVIDGVPYPSQLVHNLNGIGYGGSPLNFINPGDIESVDVLKDADATAIYGSRAANGAILITTKKGKAGKTSVHINLYSGIGEVARTIPYMNARQYLDMRYEAIRNDKDSLGDPNIYAPDLLVWDTTRYTDWQKLFLSGKAQNTNIETSVSGGNANTQFLIGGNYHRETTVFSGNSSDQKASLHFNVNNISPNRKFSIQLSGNYLADFSELPGVDLTGQIQYLPPDAPPIYNPDGTLNWANGTWILGNPFAPYQETYNAHTNNLVASLLLSYKILRGLELSTNLGYNTMDQQETIISPSTAQDPAYNNTGSAVYNSSHSNTWNIEPQLNYTADLGKGKLTALLGSTFHRMSAEGQELSASGFSSDALLTNMQAATNISTQGAASSQYRYNAVFGRLNYNWEDKYLLQLTMRRDGSSRFGPGRQWGNFGAVGGAWIFTGEQFVRKGLPFLSFGKIRGSYGITGNDLIGDYRYLNLYSPTSPPYQNTSGLEPTSLFNPNLEWEVNRKLEGGLELGFLKDRILLTASYFRNRSSNQLLSAQLSLVTGFGSIAENLPALVQNSGTEWVLNTINVRCKNFRWDSKLILTVDRNKLLAYPSLISTNYIIGKSLSSTRLFRFAGVDPQTGVYQFYDKKGNLTTTPQNPADLTKIVDLAPRYYGGLTNSFRYKGLSLDVFFQVTKQLAPCFLYNSIPGSAGFNQPTTVLSRWQKPGDITNIQRYNQDYSLENSYSNAFYSSDQIYKDASIVRLKNLALSYELKESWMKKLNVQQWRLYVQVENLLTLTKYTGYDPESQSSSHLPPLRVITAGFQITL